MQTFMKFIHLNTYVKKLNFSLLSKRDLIVLSKKNQKDSVDWGRSVMKEKRLMNHRWMTLKKQKEKRWNSLRNFFNKKGRKASD